MNSHSTIRKAPALLLLAAVLFSGCGAEPYQESIPAGNAPGGSYTAPPPFGGGDDDDDTVADGALPPITSGFTLTGKDGSNPSYTITVDTDNILKVKIISGAASNVIPGSNFSATYGCVTYTVKALGQTVTTQTLAVNGGNSLCPGAPDNQVIDLSGRLTPGHHSVPITVEASGYDFYCQGCLSYPWLYSAYPYGPYSCNMYCPLKTVYKNHGVSGTMKIQVNGTSL